jgi:hypothetical protein
MIEQIMASRVKKDSGRLHILKPKELPDKKDKKKKK